MTDISQMELSERLKDVEAVLDPDTQTVTLVSTSGKDKRQIKTQIRLVSADGSVFDRSQSGSFILGNIDKSLSMVKSTSQPT